ncbi:MAG TPA: hypothetical protein VGG72_02195 [Bryobacteraceae bacterium]
MQRRLGLLETAVIEKQSVSSVPVTVRSFQAQVEKRMRLTRESFEDAVEALVVRLRDDELEALIFEAEAPRARS